MILAIAAGAFAFTLFLGRRLDTKRNPATGFEVFIGLFSLAWLTIWLLSQALR